MRLRNRRGMKIYYSILLKKSIEQILTSICNYKIYPLSINSMEAHVRKFSFVKLILFL